MRAADLVEQYSDLPLGTADAIVVAVAERFRVVNIATFGPAQGVLLDLDAAVSRSRRRRTERVLFRLRHSVLRFSTCDAVLGTYKYQDNRGTQAPGTINKPFRVCLTCRVQTEFAESMIRSLAKGNFMILKSKRATAAALSTMAIMLTASLFAAGSASAAQSTKVTVAHSLAAAQSHAAVSAPAEIECNPILIWDRVPCMGG